MFGVGTRLRQLLLPLALSGAVHGRQRHRLLRALGLKGIGKAYIQDRCVFRGFGTRIGDGSFVNFGVRFDDSAPVNIGQRVFIGPEAMFLTGTHPIGSSHQRAELSVHHPVRVGDGCWIGARAVVLPGVSIGDGCVIAAGAVVTKDCAPDGLYGGVPARRLKDLPAKEPA